MNVFIALKGTHFLFHIKQSLGCVYTKNQLYIYPCIGLGSNARYRDEVHDYMELPQRNCLLGVHTGVQRLDFCAPVLLSSTHIYFISVCVFAFT